MANAQLRVDYLHDLDKLPVHSFINPREYSPKNQLVYAYRSIGYEKGTVYFQNGAINNGLIMYENKRIWYKPSKHEKPDKLKPEEIHSITIGIDSFFVANDFNIEKSIGKSLVTKPQFMQYITEFNGMMFAKYYHFSSGVGQSYSAVPQKIETYQVSTDRGKTWNSFPRRKNEFKEVALQYFSDIPYLKKKIENESISYDDVMTLIKSTEYHNKFKNNEMIYFDQYWNEVVNEEQSVYSAEIKSLEDSIWTLAYSQNGLPLYEAQYHALFPHKRHGYVMTMNQDGHIAQRIEYNLDEKIAEETLYNDGQVHYRYKIMEFNNGYEKYSIAKYEQVFDLEGNKLNQSDNWEETITSSIGNVTNEFNGSGISKVYRTEGNQVIYHITDPGYDFKLKKLQSRLNQHFVGKEFTDITKKNGQGTYFIRVIISEKGKAIDYEIYNQIHPDLDKMVKRWADNILSASSAYALKLKPYRIGQEKVYAEFLVPLQFSIIKFYRQPSNYDWQFHQHMMFHQQMMNQPMNLPSPPARF